ncbi:NnrU family protein [Jannaschia seohaensis]|uniref:NnrU protein n=1 Tax=Jannaschia seohaensis TaxID=475081 RepID=A0A2Y9A1F1_9RHOB|nr:NnrU family protein [Jannaschia seohaensis]PWJ22083.1 NnrU protein [Jannaschia seohaensis]SSA38361.1 NnrU protein [Jannaschia seohaensis]
MAILIAGVALWWAAHLFKRVAPEARAKLGDPGKGIVAVAVIASVVLMVIGYRQADGAWFWGRSPALVGINNLLMILAFYCYAASAAKPAKIWLGTKLRHPQLTGFSIWAVAHLLVNGDVRSFVLFGGLLVWALVEIKLINAQEGPWTPPPRAPMKKEVVALVVTVVVTVVVMLIHNWLGVAPWGA